MIGTKFGCGAALYGACTVHANGQPVRSCQSGQMMSAAALASSRQVMGLALPCAHGQALTTRTVYTPNAWVHITDNNPITL